MVCDIVLNVAEFSDVHEQNYLRKTLENNN